MAMSFTEVDRPQPLSVLWTTDSLRRAAFVARALPPKSRSPSNQVPLLLHLPYPDAELGEMMVSIGALTRETAQVWAEDLYETITRFDLAMIECQKAEESVQGIANRAVSPYEKKKYESQQAHQLDEEYERNQGRLRDTGKELGAAIKRLEQLREAGLCQRDGTKLTRADAHAYVQIAARLDVRRSTRWHVCDRCAVVFSVRRQISRPVYRCPDCKGKRIPRLRPASPLQQCGACGALFPPDDVRQVNCPTCQGDKSSRSRNPGRPVEPGTDLRRSPWIELG
jgi:predicted Zn-ribbon and HTH transcriptional regulator